MSWMSCGRYYRTCPLVIQRRFRFKTKWASTQPKKTPCDLALDHFDLYYKPVFARRWPSIRVALLSQSKYCALINNFASDREMIEMDLAELGAHDFIRAAREMEVAVDDQFASSECDVQQTPISPVEQTNSVEDSNQMDVQNFMPVKKVLSEKEQMKHDEDEQSTYRMHEESHIQVIPLKVPLHIPYDLMAYCHYTGDVSSFSPATRDDSNKLGYYLMDGASVLPVIALGLEPGSRVLDLCAAPGGKSLAILQTLLPDQLTCVDRSYSRLQRLKEVMRLYVPHSYISEGKVQCLHDNGIEFSKKTVADKNLYDRVLVDVPCYADRHVLAEEDNNIFRPNRLGERLQLQDLQKDLLFAGIQSCRPGGTIVYSTCTLAATQNDGVVMATLERIWQQTDIEVVVENLSDVITRFSSTFTFLPSGLPGSRYGCLVLPKLTANFGPMYICRMRRIN